MKLDRLLGITTTLLNKRLSTAGELAERYEVSTRTIYRDLETLSLAGIPILTAKGSGGGIMLMEGYAFDRTLISGQDSESILLALQTLQATKHPGIDKLIEKLGAILKNGTPIDWVQVDFSPWGTGPEENEKFNLIRQSILQHHILSFDYVGTGGVRSSRKIEPMTLIFRGTAWYLWAWCRMKNSFRTFRISRMRSVALTYESFDRRDPDRQTDEEDTVANKRIPSAVNLRLKFKPQVEYRLYDNYNEQMIKRNEDGTLELSISFPEDEWVYGYLFSFGPDVEVLEPAHIRKILSERMQKALKYYS